MIPTAVCEAFIRVLGDAPLAGFPEIPLVRATETAELPESYVVLAVSLSAVSGMRAERIADYSAEFSLCLRPESFSEEQVAAAVEALVEKLDDDASAEALSAAAEANPDPRRRVVFHSAFVERVAAPTFALDRIVVSVTVSGKVQFFKQSF